MDPFFSALHTAIEAGVVILLPAIGAVLAERVGVLNLGVEGMLAIGAVAAVVTASSSDSPLLCLLVAILAGSVCGLIFGFIAVVVRANQILTGLALVVLGVALANEIGAGYSGTPIAVGFEPWAIPIAHELPQLGPALFKHNPVVYVSYLVVPAVASYVLFRTRHGLNIRSIGENPAAADAAGVNVMGTRLFYSVIGGALAGAGGGYLILALTPTWSQNAAGGRGWIAIALVIFAYWRPWRAVTGALLFGAMISLGFLAQDQNWGIPTPVLTMLPYLITLVVIVVPAFIPAVRARRVGAAPAALAVPFYREDR
jgi:ABC-type uncharacterized transport system permease subunit